MIKLIKNSDVYAPSHIGKRDILICGEKIAAIEADLTAYEGLPHVEVYDAKGQTVVPGYMDGHEHYMGLGGVKRRVPELPVSAMLTAGVTTVVGLLGGDDVNHSLQDLLAKCRSLNREGVTAYMVCGSYQYPTATITGSVVTDIALIPEIVGVKVALSDGRSSNITLEEFTRLACHAQVGGNDSDKAGIVVMHVGPGKDLLNHINYALDHSELQASHFLPGHCTRNDELTEAAAKFAIERGGTFEITCGFTRAWTTITAKKITKLLTRGVPMDNMVISTDANAPQLPEDPFGNKWEEKMLLPKNLHNVIRSLVQVEGVELSEALKLATTNPARMYKLTGRKGEISVGADADIVIYGTEDMEIQTVFSRGQLAVKDGQAVLKSNWEM